MKIEEVTAAFQAARDTISENIADYVVNPKRDFIRKPRKISPSELLNYLTTEGGKSTKNELPEVGLNIGDPPSEGALTRAREKLTAKGVEALFHEFNHRVWQPLPDSAKRYRRLAFDGTRINFQSDQRYAGDEYYVQTQPGIRGVYCMHGSFLYDLSTHTYVAGTIEPIRNYNEKDALLKCIDSYTPADGEEPLLYGDRNFESYNILAHLNEHGYNFIIRAKDTHSNGVLRDIETPDTECWDIPVTVEITRSTSKKVSTSAQYVRYLDSGRRFDYLEAGSHDTYMLTFRAVRIRLDSGEYVCLLTNLPAEEFSPEALAAEYAQRWGELSAVFCYAKLLEKLCSMTRSARLLSAELCG